MDPILEEICRMRDGDLRPEVLRKWQHYIRTVLQPQLDNLTVVVLERDTYREELARRSSRVKPSREAAS